MDILCSSYGLALRNDKMDDEMMEEEFSNHDKEPLLFAWKD
jgi:hypothetical protein